MTKVAFILTHPIQYFSPFFRELSKRDKIKFKVFYTIGDNASSFDTGFNLNVKWDVDLLSGYEFAFLKNTSKIPSTNTFNGIDNPDIISIINKYNPDKIVVYGWSYKSHLNLLKYYKNKKTIYFRGDSTFIDNQNVFKNTIRALFLNFFVYKYVDFAFYVGKNNRDYFLKCGLKEEQLLYFPYSVDPSFFIQKPVDNQDSKINILYVGKLQKKKNPLILINAIKLLENPNVHLTIVGDGELKDQVTKEISNQIEYLGFKNQTELIDIYRNSDILVMPSSGPNETWGLVLNEAAASGLVLIASDKVGGAIDMIRDGYNGYIFKSDDQADLIDKLKILLNDFKYIKKLKSNSILIATGYQINNTIEIFERNILKK